MSVEDGFVRLVGDRLVHATPVENRPGIEAHGLLRPETLARRAATDPEALALRTDPVILTVDGQTARLNHQRPLHAGRHARFLDGHDIASWARQLDRRLFFWPGQARAAFEGSLGGRTALVVLDARAMLRAFGPFLDLAPINTGSATRRPAPRGDWIYVPATEAARFADNRRTRGLATGRDRVAEVSLRADIPRDALATVCVGPF